MVQRSCAQLKAVIRTDGAARAQRNSQSIHVCIIKAFLRQSCSAGEGSRAQLHIHVSMEASNEIARCPHVCTLVSAVSRWRRLSDTLWRGQRGPGGVRCAVVNTAGLQVWIMFTSCLCAFLCHSNYVHSPPVCMLMFAISGRAF